MQLFETMMKPGGTGWNDPPQLSHQVHSETKSRRNLLNKRVAYLDNSPVNISNNSALMPDVPPPMDVVPVTKIEQCKTAASTAPLNIFVPNCKDSSSPAKTEKSNKFESLDSQEPIDIVSSLLSVTKLCKTEKVTMK